MNVCIEIVEDEAAILQMLRDMMEIEGYGSVGVARADLALPVARRQRPDLFLIDIMLAGTSGIEVAQELRDDMFAQTPMIGMSASSAMIRVARDSGLFQQVVHKPFDLDVLFYYIGKLLEAATSVALPGKRLDEDVDGAATREPDIEGHVIADAVVNQAGHAGRDYVHGFGDDSALEAAAAD